MAGIGLVLWFAPSNQPRSTVCTINAEGTLKITIVNETSHVPLSSVSVQASYLAPDCPPNPHTTTNLGIFKTNIDGVVSFGGEVGEYYLKAEYFGTHAFNASTGPGMVTCVVLSLPSGQVNETHSGFLETAC